MPRFCASCGAQMADNAAACPACGKAAAQSVGGGAAAAPAPAAGIADNIGGLLCYSPIGLIMDIVFLVADPYNKNPYLRFHAFQSLFLCGAMIVLSIGLGIVSSILGILGPLALLMLPVWFVFWLACIGLCILMMIKAYGMQKYKLPIIGDLAEKQV